MAVWFEMAINTGLRSIADFVSSIAANAGMGPALESQPDQQRVLEAISSVVQAADRRERGHRTTQNLTAITT